RYRGVVHGDDDRLRFLGAGTGGHHRSPEGGVVAAVQGDTGDSGAHTYYRVAVADLADALLDGREPARALQPDRVRRHEARVAEGLNLVDAAHQLRAAPP